MTNFAVLLACGNAAATRPAQSAKSSPSGARQPPYGRTGLLDDKQKTYKKGKKMISFFLSLAALVIGYMVYGRLVERAFGPTDATTPAVALADGVDYVVMPEWKVFMIQFLNIAGTGPIFGAIMGAWYGPAAYLWIVFGCIFAGGVHDYMSGMLSLRNEGKGLPELVGKYMGRKMRALMLVFAFVLLIMVGVVFVYSPALILKDFGGSTMMWVCVIFVYYVVATTFPIDKIIGKFYPIFAFALLFMAAALFVCMVIKMPALPEIWSTLGDFNTNEHKEWLGTDSFFAKNPLFPCLFITIACGAISGFHGTQSPLMARCMRSERQGRAIFYGSMITEGVVALVWATASIWFFYNEGWREVVGEEQATAFISQFDGGKTLLQYFSAPAVVKTLCTGWLGMAGGVLAVLGVVAAPITSGDTAFRSARLIVSEALGIEQRKISNRLKVSCPIFLGCIALLAWQITNPDGFNTIWQWFGWSNQTLAVFTLWTASCYLVQSHKNYFLTLIPALFMTMVCSTFLIVSDQAFALPQTVGYAVGGTVTTALLILFMAWKNRQEPTLNKTI